jgi:hypothetical protein
MRINDNIAITRSTDMTAARAREMQQSGLNAGTLREINQDTQDEMHTVRERPDVEAALVRTDPESESGGGGQEKPQKKEKPEAPPPEDELQRRASERLLNLPVSRGKDAGGETERFDMRV